MDTYFNQQHNLGIMADHQPYPHQQQHKQKQQEEEDDDIYSISSSSSSDSLEDDATSSPSLSSLSSSSSSSSDHINTTGEGGCGGPLYEMTSLMQQLPFKRGLSKHYQGKSQSFTSLSNVRCLEDLAKPEYHHPCNKKLKSCKSYAGGLSETNNNNNNNNNIKSPRSKKNPPSARGSWSSLAAAKRSNSFLGNKPPIPPQRTSSLFNATQTPLFAS